MPDSTGEISFIFIPYIQQIVSHLSFIILYSREIEEKRDLKYEVSHDELYIQSSTNLINFIQVTTCRFKLQCDNITHKRAEGF